MQSRVIVRCVQNGDVFQWPSELWLAGHSLSSLTQTVCIRVGLARSSVNFSSSRSTRSNSIHLFQMMKYSVKHLVKTAYIVLSESRRRAS